MKNILKFLLCTVCCAVMLNDGYSMNINNVTNITTFNQFIESNEIPITSNCDELKQIICKAKHIQDKTNSMNIKDVLYNDNNSFWQILGYTFLDEIIKTNQYYNIDVQELYGKFINRKKQYSDIQTPMELIKLLLKGNLQFIAKYKNTVYNNYHNIIKLYNLSWSILVRYIIENKSKNQNAYDTLCVLWRNGIISNDLIGNEGELKFIDKQILENFSKQVFNINDNNINTINNNINIDNNKKLNINKNNNVNNKKNNINNKVKLNKNINKININNNHINNINPNHKHIDKNKKSNNDMNKININNNVINNNINQIIEQQVPDVKKDLQPILNKYRNGIGKIISSQALYLFGQNKDILIYSMFAADVKMFKYNVIELLRLLKQDTNKFITSNDGNPNTIKLFRLAWNVIYTYFFSNNNLMDQWMPHVPSEYVEKIEKIFGMQITEIKNVHINKDVNKNLENINNLSSEQNEEMEQKIRQKLSKQDNHLGLDNVGATCYMNATLQCLANINSISSKILKYFLSGKLNNNQNRYKLTQAYAEVLQGIYMPKKQDAKSYSPNRFKEVLGEMNPLFAPTAANDAKDLIIYLLEQMHTELNISQETNLNLIMPDNMNPMNRQQVFKCFANEFMKKYQSVFSDEFYGLSVSITTCNGCGVKKYSNQTFSFIIFPLLEAEKNRNLMNPMMSNQTLNLKNCFDYNQKFEFFNGSNQMYCNICQVNRDSTMQTRIETAPNTLVLILNRGKNNLDYKKPFEFWEQIDLSNYVERSDKNGNKYYLSGVVSHLGPSGPSGHFIAYCRSSQNTSWYCYNDSLVTESSWQELNSRGKPYMLFYTKINTNSKNNNMQINQNMNINQNAAINNQNMQNNFQNNNMNMQWNNFQNMNQIFNNQNGNFGKK